MLWPFNSTPHPGFIPDIDPRNASYEVLFGAPAPAIPPQFSLLKNMPPYEYQGVMPFCVSYAATKYREYLLRKLNIYRDLCPDDLAARSGTSKRGNTINNVLNVGKDFGFTNTSDHPTADKKYVTWADFERLTTSAHLSTAAQERAAELKLQGYAYLIPSTVSIHGYLAEKKEPLLITIGINGSTFNGRGSDKIIEQPTSYGAYHALLAVGYDTQRNTQVFDSLGEPTYYLATNYEILSATAITPLPDDWKKKQEQAQKNEFGNCLNHYGLPRRYTDEVVVAKQLVDAFRAKKNQSVFEAAGRFLTVYINAVTYAKYSIIDCVNDCYNWRRTNKHIFNFNSPRR